MAPRGLRGSSTDGEIKDDSAIQAQTCATRPQDQSIPVRAGVDAAPGDLRRGRATQRRRADERRRRTARRHPLPDGARDGPGRRRPVSRLAVDHALRQESPAAGRTNRRRRGALPHQARLHRGDGRRPRHRFVGRFVRDVRRPADAGRRGVGAVGDHAAQRQRPRRHGGAVLPGDQPTLHRGRRRPGLAPEGDFPGDGGPRFLSRRRHHGRRATPARGPRIRVGLHAAQRGQSDAGVARPRRSRAAALGRSRRGSPARTRSAALLPATDRRGCRRRRDRL